MKKINQLSTVLTGKRVLVTGHTGFKGSWLCLWLRQLGAEVYGFSLNPESSPAMFNLCNVECDIDHQIGDIRDIAALNSRLMSVKPDVVFHLAAQAIVRQSYLDPLDTLSTNIMGTANVMEAVRAMNHSCALVVVSSDKCYENKEWIWGYRENDPMGGNDPYSMSKGATELLVSSWRSSFFGAESKVKLASARAGNVIGGGDWSKDRIIPDCIRAFSQGKSLELRNPHSTRPWQHVLEPLSGYLTLACRLLGEQADEYCSGWNFGPTAQDVRPVENVVKLIADHWDASCDWILTQGAVSSEASMLSLNCDKAISKLGWHPTWNLEQSIFHTTEWYQTWIKDPGDLRRVTLDQIDRFQVDTDESAFTL